MKILENIKINKTLLSAIVISLVFGAFFIFFHKSDEDKYVSFVIGLEEECNAEVKNLVEYKECLTQLFEERDNNAKELYNYLIEDFYNKGIDDDYIEPFKTRHDIYGNDLATCKDISFEFDIENIVRDIGLLTCNMYVTEKYIGFLYDLENTWNIILSDNVDG